MENNYNCCGCCKEFDSNGKCKVDDQEIDIYCGCEDNFKRNW